MNSAYRRRREPASRSRLDLLLSQLLRVYVGCSRSGPRIDITHPEVIDSRRSVAWAPTGTTGQTAPGKRTANTIDP